MLVQAMQSTFATTERFGFMYLTQEIYRLCEHAQPHALRLDAKPVQSALPRRGAGDVPHSEGEYDYGNSSDANVEHGMLFLMFGVGSIPWSPLGCGLLTRIARDATQRGKTDAWASGYDMPFLGELTTRYVRLDAPI